MLVWTTGKAVETMTSSPAFKPGVSLWRVYDSVDGRISGDQFTGASLLDVPPGLTAMEGLFTLDTTIIKSNRQGTSDAGKTSRILGVL
ncbi:MAG: hypothetical protein JW839_07215 [Candidatus Lokiarchaeota archaeon]|nr:hypothetical protein [Candidatus Lokiarchaeota archaeon]